nr:uncharacterized protein LOC125634847 [Caretta caretta]
MQSYGRRAAGSRAGDSPGNTPPCRLVWPRCRATGAVLQGAGQGTRQGTLPPAVRSGPDAELRVLCCREPGRGLGREHSPLPSGLAPMQSYGRCAAGSRAGDSAGNIPPCRQRWPRCRATGTVLQGARQGTRQGTFPPAVSAGPSAELRALCCRETGRGLGRERSPLQSALAPMQSYGRCAAGSRARDSAGNIPPCRQRWPQCRATGAVLQGAGQGTRQGTFPPAVRSGPDAELRALCCREPGRGLGREHSPLQSALAPVQSYGRCAAGSRAGDSAGNIPPCRQRLPQCRATSTVLQGNGQGTRQGTFPPAVSAGPSAELRALCCRETGRGLAREHSPLQSALASVQSYEQCAAGKRAGDSPGNIPPCSQRWPQCRATSSVLQGNGQGTRQGTFPPAVRSGPDAELRVLCCREHSPLQSALAPVRL